MPKAPRKSKSPAKVTGPAAAAPQSILAQKDDRCRHYTAKGRRCRLAVLDPASGLCFRHVGRQFLSSAGEDLSPAFLGLLSGFQSASQIHAFVTQVTVLLVQNRLSTRRAAVLAYLAQILLRTLPAIDLELHPAAHQDDQNDNSIVLDIPCAVATRAQDPERAFYKRMSTLYGSSPTPTDSSSASPERKP
jgi:hypothetical protein